MNNSFLNTITMQVFRGKNVEPPQQGLAIQILDGRRTRDPGDPVNWERYTDLSGNSNYGVINTSDGKINLNPNDNAALRWPNQFLTTAEAAALQNGDEDFISRVDGIQLRVLAYPTSTVFGVLDDTAAALYFVRRYPTLTPEGEYMLVDDRIVYSGGLIYPTGDE